MRRSNFISAASVLVLLGSAAEADSIYAVTLNTSTLVGSGPLSLDFQFVDGSGAPSDLNNNIVKLESFVFGAGGGPSGGGSASGGASGSLASGVTLADSSFFNEYVEGFTPGPLLTFTIDTTNVADPGGTPDELSLGILDANGNELPTTGPASELFDVILQGGTAPAIDTFGAAPGSGYSFGAPVFQSQSAVPEPSAQWLIALGLALCTGGRLKIAKR